MPARYHPLYDGIWNEEKFDGAPFEEVGFFIYLFGNSRQRPSGIYRVTDQQMTTDTRLPLARVRRYVADLDQRQAIVRDKLWMFVGGYFGRQPKHENLLNGVTADILGCSSARVLRVFADKYPTFKRRLGDRWPTIHSMVVPTEQLPAVQGNTEQSRTNPHVPRREVPESIAEVAARVLGKTVAEVRASAREVNEP
jgi:hypothetical protein